MAVELARSVHWVGHLMMSFDEAHLTEKFFASGAIGWRDEELARVHAHFEDRRAVPKFETLRALAPNCLLHLVDTQSLNPAGYQVTHWDTRATLDGGRDYTGLLLGDYPIPVYRENMEQQVCTAWSMHTRRYSEVKWSRDGGETRRFNRLIVPLRSAPGRRDVCQVLVATHPQPRNVVS